MIIDEDTYHGRIDARRAYRMRPNGRPDHEGHVRLLCPASGAAPTARCDLKPNSITPTTAGRTRIPLTDAHAAQPPKVCTPDSVTFPPEAGAKLLQPLHYGSPEWHARYTLRNSVEGLNGNLKDDAHGALDDPERRRIRGVAAQSIFTAFIAMAANLKAITSFMRTAVAGQDGTLRRARKPRRTTAPIQSWQPELVDVGIPPP